MECNKEQNRQQRHGEWGFTFCEGTPATPWEEEGRSEILRQAADSESGAVAPFPLALSKVGDRVWIVGIRSQEVISRLLALRLTSESELAIISQAIGGSVIVAFQDNRIGLGQAWLTKFW